MNQMKIVEITSFSDQAYEKVCALAGQLSDQPIKITIAHFKQMLNSGNTHLFFIENEEDIVVGMLTVGIYDTPTESKAWMEDVVIDDHYRGCGYGKILVTNAIDFAKRKGVTTLALTSNPTRIAANALYRSLGFHPYQTNVYKIKF